MKPEAENPEEIAEIRSALLDHYDRRARDLPWRRDRDPYRILVSEIMLQQTRVETVLGYYDPWLERFPTVTDLADADEDEVMKAWEGLGYYRRARNLHRAAGIIRDRPGGMPSDYDALKELPGVGEYTAGAVASIAFREAVPAVDGNVRRVLARLYDEPRPTPAWLRERAEALVHPERPGDWNQALMELGATVCTPRSPSCGLCPVSRWCAARRGGTQLERPAPQARKAVPEATFVVAVLEHDDRILVRKREADGLLGGMWGLPERKLEEPSDAGDPVDGDARHRVADVARELAVSLELVPAAARPLDAVTHRFTHLSATYLPVALALGETPPETTEEAVRWIDPEDDPTTALPTAYRKVVDTWRNSRPEEQS